MPNIYDSYPVEIMMGVEREMAASDLMRAVIDLAAMLEHYAGGRRLNRDGSTRTQAMRAIKAGNKAVARARAAGIGAEDGE